VSVRLVRKATKRQTSCVGVPSQGLAAARGLLAAGSQDEVVRMAMLIAEPGRPAWLLNPDNSRGDRLDVESAARSGQPFFVRVSSSVLAVDFDRDDAVQAANRLYWTARMLGLPALLVASGQRGRRHVFVWPENDDQRTHLITMAKADHGDVRPDIRPPLAPHRLGHLPQVLGGLDTLPGFADSSVGPTRTWGVRGRDTAILGRPEDSRSERIYSVALAAVNAGWSLPEFRDLLSAEGCAVADDFAGRVEDRGPDVTERWLQHQIWSPAQAWVRDHPAKRQERDPVLARLRDEVDHLPWSGLAGASQRALYIAMIDKAEKAGSTEFSCSQRQLMELAGLRSRRTVQSAADRLEDKHLISRRGRTAGRSSRPGDPHRNARTSTWQLLTDHLPSTPRLGRVAGRRGNDGIGHDAFLNVAAGLGKNAHRIWSVLGSSSASTAQELTIATGLTIRTVKKHLSALARAGLVDCTDSFWEVVRRPLDAVAAEQGTLGFTEQLKKRHVWERDVYDEHHEARYKRREARPTPAAQSGPLTLTNGGCM